MEYQQKKGTLSRVSTESECGNGWMQGRFIAKVGVGMDECGGVS